MGLAQVFIISIWVMAISVETDVEEEKGLLTGLWYLHWVLLNHQWKWNLNII